MPSDAVFFNYRREQSAFLVGWLYDQLAPRFGKASIFVDVRSIAPAKEWDTAIKLALARTRVFVVFIGPGWLDELKERSSDPAGDWVRKEIQIALASPSIVVLPVLIDNAKMPDDLPGDLADLARRQSLNVRPLPDFYSDAATLSAALERMGVRRSASLFPWAKGQTKLQTVWVMRHTRAVKLPVTARYREDMARALTAEGRSDAEAFGARIKARGIEFVSVGASPAERAIDTASCVSGWSKSEVVPIKALEPPNPERSREAPHIDFLYDNIGDAALSGYRIVDRDAAAMDRYGRRTWRGVRAFLQSSQAGHVLIVGHAILSQAVFFSAIRGRTVHFESLRQRLLNEVLLQGQCFKVLVENEAPVDVEVGVGH